MLRALCARRAVAALALSRFVAAPCDLLPKSGVWIGDDGRFAKSAVQCGRIFVDSVTGEGIWLPAVDSVEIEASSVKKKRKKKMNKHKHKKLRRQNRHSKKKK